MNIISNKKFKRIKRNSTDKNFKRNLTLGIVQLKLLFCPTFTIVLCITCYDKSIDLYYCNDRWIPKQRKKKIGTW